MIKKLVVTLFAFGLLIGCSTNVQESANKTENTEKTKKEVTTFEVEFEGTMEDGKMVLDSIETFEGKTLTKFGFGETKKDGETYEFTYFKAEVSKDKFEELKKSFEGISEDSKLKVKVLKK